MNYAIIVAAGTGNRFQSNQNKIWYEIDGTPLFYHTIQTFEDCVDINGIVVVHHPEEVADMQHFLKEYNFQKIQQLVPGGKSRQQSVYNGLQALEAQDEDIVLVHNGANALFSEKELEELLKAHQEKIHVAVGRPVSSSLKRVEKDGTFKEHLPRHDIWEMETPQGSQYKYLREAHEQAQAENYEATDETELLHRYGHQVTILETDPSNIKVTHPRDIAIVESALLKRKS